jgi:hypothetical protein
MDYGPGSILLNKKCEKYDGIIRTTTIDDFLISVSGTKLDFIKMDIEGSELNALKGAKKVICKYRPKLAISVYHHPEDIYEIPKWIESLNLGYKFYLGHFTTHRDETILFAKI